MLKINDSNSLRLYLASPDEIRSWSYGEVTKPETINYRTLKPEKDGLFCERIFGPTKDYECSCGKYKKVRYKGHICEKCGVEVTHSSVRRGRMGHIELAAPVAHIWFVKVTPSRLGLLLDLSPKKLEQVIYFAKFLVTYADEEARAQAIDELRDELELKSMQEPSNGEAGEVEEERGQSQEQLKAMIKELEELRPLKLLGMNECRELKSRWGRMFQAEMGAEAILEYVKRLDLGRLHENLAQEVASSSGQNQRKAVKRLRVVESFRKRGAKPEWMILTALPVMPAELRPMVQLDGGRFATSDINDLYRRVINRNNRLKRLKEMGAPEIIMRNEKRMLQEAVDSLLDNGRRGQPVTSGSGHVLKSLSEAIRGKQGHFRQNLLGKRVDYSGRSVIVAGPDLKPHQCGLPKRMALELFKPFIMHRLIERGLAHNVKLAKRAVEQGRGEVWGILEEVTKDHPVLLNRAPTLHRLGIQAFYPVLIDSSAIQIHPLVCAGFNADFDGDQMAVHVPLSRPAIEEARTVMLSSNNLLLPSSGEPVVTPTREIILGCYYLTSAKRGVKGEGKVFADFDDARLAYDMGVIDLAAEIEVRDGDERLKTTVGRIIFNEALPKEFGFYNKLIDKNELKQLTSECCRRLGNEVAITTIEEVKRLGFEYSTKSGLTMAISDLEIPQEKTAIIQRADEEVKSIEEQFEEGLMTEDERYESTVGVWSRTVEEVTRSLGNSLNREGPIYMMASSGARGSIDQIRQMAGMRGLMSDPSGQIIELPIKACFREGLSVLEYFISTHGARKGLADTALRTSDSGYLTRRLIDVAQEVMVKEKDCGTREGIWVSEPKDKGLLPSLTERIVARIAACPIAHPETGEIIVDGDEEIDVEKACKIIEAGVGEVCVRSPLTCKAHFGVCQRCYGIDLASGKLVDMDSAVGIIAAQSIGEPGTQLTMRTFHTGGIAGAGDITTGLPRVEELFEARHPKGGATIAEIEGVVEITECEGEWRIKIVNIEGRHDDYPLPQGYKVMVSDGQVVEPGQVLAMPSGDGETKGSSPILSKAEGKVEIQDGHISVRYHEKKEWGHVVPPQASFLISSGDQVKAGDQLTEGALNPQDILRVKGVDSVQRYMVDEVQKVYRNQGVNIHDKHIEIIISRMLCKVLVDFSGDTELLPGELIERGDFEQENTRVLAEGKEPAIAYPVLLGITKASLSAPSFLATASFQETTRALTEAAISASVDHLLGLKENVIIGRLIPAQSKVTSEMIAEQKRLLEEPSRPPTLGDVSLPAYS